MSSKFNSRFMKFVVKLIWCNGEKGKILGVFLVKIIPPLLLMYKNKTISSNKSQNSEMKNGKCDIKRQLMILQLSNNVLSQNDKIMQAKIKIMQSKFNVIGIYFKWESLKTKCHVSKLWLLRQDLWDFEQLFILVSLSPL